MTDKINNTGAPKKLWLIIAAVILAVLVVLGSVLAVVIGGDKLPSFNGSELNIRKFTPITVYEGLQVTTMGDYSGLFLEDGSDEIVTSIMMIVLENTSQKDLQLARIKAESEGFTAEFEATNLPAGEKVVLLESNRRKTSGENYTALYAEDVVFFQENMSLMEDTFKATFGEGFVELENISGEDVEGTTYIYYKNIADDTLFGGITYRARIEEEIPKGESVRVLTNHFSEKNTEIMQIVNVK